MCCFFLVISTFIDDSIESNVRILIDVMSRCSGDGFYGWTNIFHVSLMFLWRPNQTSLITRWMIICFKLLSKAIYFYVWFCLFRFIRSVRRAYPIRSFVFLIVLWHLLMPWMFFPMALQIENHKHNKHCFLIRFKHRRITKMKKKLYTHTHKMLMTPFESDTQRKENKQLADSHSIIECRLSMRG